MIFQIRMGWQYYWNPWFSEDYLYSVQFDPARCQELLKEGTTRTGWRSPVGRRASAGDDLQLYRVKMYVNGFSPEARVECQPAPDGSTVKVKIGPGRLNGAGAAIWFWIWGLWTVATIADAIRNQSWDWLTASLIGVGFLTVWELLSASGRLLARHDPEFLLTYVQGRLGIGSTAKS